MEWNVYVADFNGKKIETYNIFKHAGFLRDCKRACDFYLDDKEKFLKVVESSLMYHFWCKYEYEVTISGMIFGDESKKADDKSKIVDVYSQVVLNWDVFSEYIWSHRGELVRDL